MNYKDKHLLRAAFFIGAFTIAVTVVVLGVVELFFT